jgi:hypothetical protein
MHCAQVVFYEDRPRRSGISIWIIMRYMRGSHGVFNDKERGGAGQLVLALQYWSAFKRCDFRSFVARVPSVDCCWCFSNVVFSRVPVIRNNTRIIMPAVASVWEGIYSYVAVGITCTVWCTHGIIITVLQSVQNSRMLSNNSWRDCRSILRHNKMPAVATILCNASSIISHAR